MVTIDCHHLRVARIGIRGNKHHGLRNKGITLFKVIGRRGFIEAIARIFIVVFGTEIHSRRTGSVTFVFTGSDSAARRGLVAHIFAIALFAAARTVAIAVAARVATVSARAQVRIASAAGAIVTTATIIITGAASVAVRARAIAIGASAIAVRASAVTIRTSVIAARARSIATGAIAIACRAQIGTAAGIAVVAGARAVIRAARLYAARRFMVFHQRRTALRAARKFFIATRVTAFTNHAHTRKRSQVVKVVVNPLHVNQDVVVNQLLGVCGIIHKNHVTRIGCHKKVTVTIRGTLVQTPAHATGSRAAQIRLRFFKEIFTKVNRCNDFRLDFATFAIRLDLHNARTAEHKDRLGISIVGATMSTFQGVNQNLGTDRSNDLITNVTAISTAVRIGHSHPSRIGKHAEIRILEVILILAFLFRTGPISAARFAAATEIVRTRKEGRTIAVPNHGCQFLVFFRGMLRSLGSQFNLITSRCKVVVLRIGFRRKTVQITWNTGSPKVISLRVHHQMPETALTRRRSSPCDTTCTAIFLGGLTHLENTFALTGHQQVAIRMVNNTIGTFHAIAFGTKSLLVRGFHEQVTRTIVLVANALDAVALFVLGIVQRGLGSSMRHDIANLLNPNTRCRIFRSRVIYACSVACRRRQ